MLRYLPRSLRPSTPAKILLGLILIVLWLQFPPNLHRPQVTLGDADSQDRLQHASHSSLLAMYEDIRESELERKGFNATDSARRIRAELTMQSGRETFDPSSSEYIARLRRFVDGWCTHSPSLRKLHDSLDRAARKGVDRGEVVRRVWSTHRDGNVDEHFHLWETLLPKPLPEELKRRIGPVDEGGWEVTVADDDAMDRMVSEWTGEKVSRGIEGRAQWEALWGKMGFGVLRSDLFRYMALLFEGGIYADSDTAPIAHPYLWGARSESMAHPDLAIIQEHLSNLAVAAPPKDRLNPREDIGYVPPYVRTPTSAITPTIASPEINLVVAIEWDSSFAWNWRRWPQWTAFRLRRSREDCCGGRSLQIAQYALAAKPFHPVLIDAVQSVVGLVYHGGLDRLGALDVTGPGPFTDAVLRYLIVQYGITPEDLRDLRGPTRIGDVLILQEEALLAPESAMRRMMRHVYEVLPNKGGNPWYWGMGYESWRSGGVQVVYHGLTGSWKGQGWNE